MALLKMLRNALLGAALTLGLASPALAGAQDTVDRSLNTLNDFLSDQDLSAIPQLLQQAQGVLIVPAFIKGSFLVGGARGEGVLLARTPDGRWSNPVFYNITQGSLGLQVGATSTQLLFIINTERGLRNALSGEGTIGADIGAAMGPGKKVGAQADEIDMYTYAKIKGGYAGMSFSGGEMAPAGSDNREYYGSPGAEPAAIAAGQFGNPGANALVQALNQYRPL